MQYLNLVTSPITQSADVIALNGKPLIGKMLIIIYLDMHAK